VVGGWWVGCCWNLGLGKIAICAAHQTRERKARFSFVIVIAVCLSRRGCGVVVCGATIIIFLYSLSFCQGVSLLFALVSMQQPWWVNVLLCLM
jgi:hypothetical protein